MYVTVLLVLYMLLVVLCRMLHARPVTVSLLRGPHTKTPIKSAISPLLVYKGQLLYTVLPLWGVLCGGGHVIFSETEWVQFHPTCTLEHGIGILLSRWFTTCIQWGRLDKKLTRPHITLQYVV